MDKTQTEELTYTADPLSLDLSDYELVQVINKRVTDSKAHFSKHNISTRQDKNLKYLVGNQVDESSLKDFNVRYMDNILYEAEASIKPIALSRLPDLIVKQGGEGEESKKAAQDLSEIINNDIRRRENRKVLSIAFKHIPIYLTAIIKAVWNPEKGKHGDYEFINVNPKDIVFDHTVKSNNTEDMDFIAEEIELSVKEVIMRFPEAEEGLLSELGMNTIPSEGQLASKIKYLEVWFTWYKKDGAKYERVEGLVCKFRNIILKKMKNPNWDWEGDTNTFTYNTKLQERVQPQEDEMRDMVMSPEDSPLEQQTEKIYHNHFENPRKPYIVLGYDQYNLGPYDATSRIEQNIYLQDNVNMQGRKITELAQNAGGKNVWSKLGGLKKEDIEEMDMTDPYEDVLVDGEVNRVHSHIPGQQPTSALFQAQDQNRNRIFSKMGVSATTRGSVETDTATTAQIARESDFGRIDDLTEETVNFAAQEMAGWAMQFIKLRYTDNHVRRIAGKNGTVALKRVQRDMVEDGMEIEVFASGVDKVMRKREAYEKAKLKLIDPLTFFEDIDAPDPEERTKRLLMFLSKPEQYVVEYGMGLGGTEGQVTALTGQTPEALMAQPEPGPEDAMPQDLSQELAQPTNTFEGDLQQLMQGQQPQITQPPDDNYLAQLNQFIQSVEFTGLPPEQQSIIAEFAQQVIEISRGQQEQPMPPMVS